MFNYLRLGIHWEFTKGSASSSKRCWHIGFVNLESKGRKSIEWRWKEVPKFQKYLKRQFWLEFICHFGVEPRLMTNHPDQDSKRDPQFFYFTPWLTHYHYFVHWDCSKVPSAWVSAQLTSPFVFCKEWCECPFLDQINIYLTHVLLSSCNLSRSPCETSRYTTLQ